MNTPWTFNWANDTGPDDDCYIEFYEIWNSAFQRIGTAEEKEDARLMAAAPELLEALKGVLRVADRKTDEFDAARAAINKATGEHP